MHPPLLRRLPALLRPLQASIPSRRNLTTTTTLQTESQQQPPPPDPPTEPSEPHLKPPTTESPLFYPPSTSPHTSLPSFLSHASRVGLDPSSTVYVGTHFEYTAITSLSRLRFSLQRVGGRSDFGIDLLGTWSLPARDPLRVLVQCKVARTKVMAGPRFIRELEGAFAGAPAGWRGKGVIGVLVTEQVATKGIRDAIGRSKWPMVFVTCSRAGIVTQFLWNRAAAEEGLLDLAVGVRYNFVEGEEVKEVVLTWKGKSIPPAKEEKEKGQKTRSKGIPSAAEEEGKGVKVEEVAPLAEEEGKKERKPRGRPKKIKSDD
ncbi:hypothetical protein QBC35DRAFT_10524 [Podospora australis]|uniref:Required for respiratory growth protein 7, mitochondrial n=1 Tax=Podospora australis TaxID=1536484 RepID=A0AAN6X5U3_9PEZI|nr:hypothetical protein QBC35DRAFT_10524 [Podospora australis]